MSKSSLKATANSFRCIGTLYEKDLKQEACKIKITDEQGNQVSTRDGECIKGKIAVKNGTGVQTFFIYFSNMTSKGEEPYSWNMAQKMLDWNPQIKGDRNEPVTVVDLRGAVEMNDFFDKKGKLQSGLRWRISSARTVNEDDVEDGTSLFLTLYLNNIDRETVDEDETGRLDIIGYAVGRNGDCFPVKFKVPEESADDVEEFYNVGDTVPVVLSYLVTHKGAASEPEEPARKVIGKGKVAVQKPDFADYDRRELVFLQGEVPIEEPEEKTYVDDEGNEVETPTEWIDPDAMKKAIKVRKQKLKEMEEKGPENKTKSTSTSRSAQAKQAVRESKKSVGKGTSPWDDSELDFEDML